MMYPASLTI